MTGRHQIARAYNQGWTPPVTAKRARGNYGRRLITVEGETKGLLDWSRDPRNVHRVSAKTLSKRANNPMNLVSIEVWLRETANPVRRKG